MCELRNFFFTFQIYSKEMKLISKNLNIIDFHL